jgi:hypothetical protein
MDKKLIPEIDSILHNYNGCKLREHFATGGHDYGEVYTPITLDEFEKKIDWEWVSQHYHTSYAFIYEYQDKLNMQYLYDNFVITEEEFEKMRKENEIDDRFEIMDL